MSLQQVVVVCCTIHNGCIEVLQAGVGRKAGMTPDQVAIVARLKANNAQLNLRPELRGKLSQL